MLGGEPPWRRPFISMPQMLQALFNCTETLFLPFSLYVPRKQNPNPNKALAQNPQPPAP